MHAELMRYILGNHAAACQVPRHHFRFRGGLNLLASISYLRFSSIFETGFRKLPSYWFPVVWRRNCKLLWWLRGRRPSIYQTLVENQSNQKFWHVNKTGTFMAFPGASDSSWDCHLWPLGTLGWPYIFSLLPPGQQCLPAPTLHELGSSWSLSLYPTFIPNATSPLSVSYNALPGLKPPSFTTWPTSRAFNKPSVSTLTPTGCSGTISKWLQGSDFIPG